MNPKREKKKQKAREHNRRADEREQNRRQSERERAKNRAAFREVNACLEITAFTAIFMIASKTETGRARIMGDQNLEEVYSTYVRDAQSLQYLQWQILIEKYPNVVAEIMTTVLKNIDNLPAELRRIFHDAQKAIADHGRDALKIPEEVVRRLEEGATKMIPDGEEGAPVRKLNPVAEQLADAGVICDRPPTDDVIFQKGKK